jgi:hypothetical protein
MSPFLAAGLPPVLMPALSRCVIFQDAKFETALTYPFFNVLQQAEGESNRVNLETDFLATFGQSLSPWFSTSFRSLVRFTSGA